MTDSREGMTLAWQGHMLRLRAALSCLGVELIPSGPGESQDCDHFYRDHCLMYAAALQARMEWELYRLSLSRELDFPHPITLARGVGTSVTK
jgi:hypothetical protein